MKWTDQKSDLYSRIERGIRGRKNGSSFEISDYTKGFTYEHLGWYVCVRDLKTDKRDNSLWSDLWWTDIEDAKQWCEDYKWKEE